MRIALFEPDIPQNTGAILRLAACLNIGVDIIEPCGFILSNRLLKRSGMDYIRQVNLKIHESWGNYISYNHSRNIGRIILMTTKASHRYTDFQFSQTDTLLFGSESSGVPDTVHTAACARLLVPISRESRSLNIVTTAAIVVGEALRQTNGYPE